MGKKPTIQEHQEVMVNRGREVHKTKKKNKRDEDCKGKNNSGVKRIQDSVSLSLTIIYRHTYIQADASSSCLLFITNTNTNTVTNTQNKLNSSSYR